jgi:putative aminopeptidase FrvX
MDDTLTLLKDLTDAPGVSGFEEPVRRVMRRYLEPLAEISTDNIGSVIGRRVGRAGGGLR